MTLPLPDGVREAVQTALDEGDFETAVEIVFQEHPDATRDEVVDTVEEERV